MDAYYGNHDVKIIDFSKIYASGGGFVASRRAEGGRPVVIPFGFRVGQEASNAVSGLYTGQSIMGWRRALRRRARMVSEGISGAHSAIEYAAVGFEHAVGELGIDLGKTAEDLARWMSRSLTYRLPNEVWHAIHELDDAAKGGIMLTMVSFVHDGWARDNVQEAFGMGQGREYLFLPIELCGMDSFEVDAAIIMRYLPSLGLDGGMELPSEYGGLYSNETVAQALASPSYALLADAYRQACVEFARSNEIDGLDDLVCYIMTYGEVNQILGAEASAALRDPEIAREVAMQVARNDFDRIFVR